jgi:glutamate-ammonia-ligase adenylyltransferase
MSAVGPLGRLYDVDMKLRPAGKSSSLVVPLAEFRRYFAGGGGELWERQALTRARVIRGDAAFANEVSTAIRDAILDAAWTPAAVDAVRSMREKLEATATPRNLKRGPGGIVDVEFVIQLLILKYARRHPELLKPNAWDALDAAEAAGLLSGTEARDFREGYSFLRFVEARLRVVTDRPLTEVPAAAEDREKLARRLGFDAAGGQAAALFTSELHRQTSRIREAFEQVTTRERRR